jgi:hypothetical protein
MRRHTESEVLTPPQVVPPEFVTLFFSGKISRSPVNFDRILTKSVHKLTES